MVLPEAWSSEEKKLLDFTLSCARLFPNFNFIFRPHPISMFNFGNYKLKNLTNLQISKASFDKDISNCNLIFLEDPIQLLKLVKMDYFRFILNFQAILILILILFMKLKIK